MKHILIVEDEAPLIATLTQKLEGEGYIVTVATTGTEALALLDHHTYNLILLDLLLPECDGFEVLDTLQTQGDKTPTVVLTNISKEESVENAKKLGAATVLIKADTALDDVITEIHKHIREAG